MNATYETEAIPSNEERAAWSSAHAALEKKLNKYPVEPGEYDVGGVEVNVKLADDAKLIREWGEKADGIIYGPPKPREFTPNALLWFYALSETNPPVGKRTVTSMMLEAIHRDESGREAPIPGWFKAALDKYWSKTPPEPTEKRTSAVKFGVDQAVVEVCGLPEVSELAAA